MSCRDQHEHYASISPYMSTMCTYSLGHAAGCVMYVYTSVTRMPKECILTCNKVVKIITLIQSIALLIGYYSKPIRRTIYGLLLKCVAITL